MEPHSRPSGHHFGLKYMLAGGTVVAAIGLLFEPQALFSKLAPSKAVCQDVIHPQAVLSRDRLSQLLTIPERTPKAQIQPVIPEPYCRLSGLPGQPGNVAQREAYPLAFDPKTWLVVTYKGDEYAGYSFSFQR